MEVEGEVDVWTLRRTLRLALAAFRSRKSTQRLPLAKANQMRQGSPRMRPLPFRIIISNELLYIQMHTHSQIEEPAG